MSNYLQIKPVDVANGPGCRVSIWMSGCSRHCPGCFNPEAWPYDAGQPFTELTTDRIVTLLSPDHISGLTILGGEPLDPKNLMATRELIMLVRAASSKSIWLYTGYRFEDLYTKALTLKGWELRYILSECNVIVDGPFIEEQKNLKLRFRGSRNQRIINVPDTLNAFHRGDFHVYMWDPVAPRDKSTMEEVAEYGRRAQGRPEGEGHDH